ncbi:MAG TPA: hypothetical protein VFB15_10185 [Candidatus Binataceae bacterium]|nr:hypothetical protein [Candidatus Binataceae bacterium]
MAEVGNSLSRLGRSITTVTRNYPLTLLATAAAAGVVVGGGARSPLGRLLLKLAGQAFLQASVLDLFENLVEPSGGPEPDPRKPPHADTGL